MLVKFPENAIQKSKGKLNLRIDEILKEMIINI
jgi:hypothetical protein